MKRSILSTSTSAKWQSFCSRVDKRGMSTLDERENEIVSLFCGLVFLEENKEKGIEDYRIML